MGASAKEIQADLKKLSNPKDAEFLQRFFKTAEGQYGHGDRFRGIRVPASRQIVKKHSDAELETAVDLLASEFHEDRLVALLMMVKMYDRGDEKLRERVYKAYLSNTDRINNWDLVDSSAPYIVGRHLMERSRKPLYRLAVSRSLWERRIAVLSTFYFIKYRQFDDSIAIAEKLLDDKEDLMHKAVGWMIREVANRDGDAARKFLRRHYRKMPRTMLRYAIEKFPETERQSYLKGSA
jgi:Predicted DNA alkylation repair enzyme